MDTVRPTIRVLIVDDHPLAIAGIRTFLAEHRHIEIIGEASHGMEAIEKARQLLPDIILMDIDMPGMNGLDAARILSKEMFSTDVIFLSMYDEKGYVMQIKNTGAKGYVLKNAPQGDIVKAIESVFRGNAFFSPEIAKYLLETSEVPLLNENEQNILILIVEDYSNKQIADKLNINVRQVEKVRSRIMQKLDIHSVVGLTRYAISKGLVKP